MSQIIQFRSLNAPVETLTGNDAVAVSPILANINFLGDGVIVTVTGDIVTGTMLINTPGLADKYITDAGTAVPLLGELNVIGGANINTELLAPATNTIAINLDDDVSILGSFDCVDDITSSTGNLIISTGTITSLGTILSSAGDIELTLGDFIAAAGGVDVAASVDAGVDLIAGNDCIVDQDISVTNGDISVVLGVINALGSITSTSGDIVSTLGSVTAGDTVDAVNNITSSTGDIVSTLGAGSFATSVTAGNDLHVLAGGADIVGTVEFSDLTAGTMRTSAAGVISALADGTDGQTLISSTAGTPIWANILSADGSVVITDAANAIDLSAGGLNRDNILYVGKHGNDAENGRTPSRAKLTIQAAVTAAAVGDTIIVYPGTYTETITHAANNVTILAQGKPSNCIITQADANVINFAGYTGIQYKFFQIRCTAATTAIWTAQGTTGSCSFKECQLSMTSAAAIAAINQPGVARVTGAGALSVILGKVYYYHTGNGGGTAQKSAFSVANGGAVTLQLIDDLVITNSGTAFVSSIALDTASTGNFEINDCHITITDPNASLVIGLAYLSGTGTDHEFYRNEIHVNVTNNIGYGFFSADTASTTRFFYNHIHVSDTAGTSYSYYVGAGATVTAIFDDVVAADGASVNATGIFYEVKSPSDGDFICSGPYAAGTRYLTVANTDNTATASNSAVNVSVGGATSTGDPYTNYLVTGAGTYSLGIDNSDSDNFKITTGATPSAGTDLFTMSSTGVITLNNNLDISEGGTGVSTLTQYGVLVGNAATDIQALAVGATNQVLLGNTGANPSWGAVDLTTDITGILPAGNGGTGAATLTDHGLLIGNTTNAITATAEGATGTLLTGVTGNEPTWTTATYPATAAIGTILISSGANVITTLAPSTAGYVLTDGGAGVAPSWQANATLAWNTEAGATVSMAVNNSYINQAAGLTTLTLPATAAVGDLITVCGEGAGGWKIAQNATQEIQVGSAVSTNGVGGYVASTNRYDTLSFVCRVANTTWQALSFVGVLDVA